MFPLARSTSRQISPSKRLEAYTQLLEHLSCKLSPADLVAVLPENGNVAFFMPYIERCHRAARAELLRKRIIDEQTALLREEASKHQS